MFIINPPLYSERVKKNPSARCVGVLSCLVYLLILMVSSWDVEITRWGSCKYDYRS